MPRMYEAMPIESVSHLTQMLRNDSITKVSLPLKDLEAIDQSLSEDPSLEDDLCLALQAPSTVKSLEINTDNLQRRILYTILTRLDPQVSLCLEVEKPDFHRVGATRSLDRLLLPALNRFEDVSISLAQTKFRRAFFLSEDSVVFTTVGTLWLCDQAFLAKSNLSKLFPNLRSMFIQDKYSLVSSFDFTTWPQHLEKLTLDNLACDDRKSTQAFADYLLRSSIHTLRLSFAKRERFVDYILNKVYRRTRSIQTVEVEMMGSYPEEMLQSVLTGSSRGTIRSFKILAGNSDFKRYAVGQFSSAIPVLATCRLVRLDWGKWQIPPSFLRTILLALESNMYLQHFRLGPISFWDSRNTAELAFFESSLILRLTSFGLEGIILTQLPAH